MKKVVIALEDVQKHIDFRHRINKVSLRSIVLTEHGKPIHIEKRNVEEFMLTGLNNIDFISSGFYKKETLILDKGEVWQR